MVGTGSSGNLYKSMHEQNSPLITQCCTRMCLTGKGYQLLAL